MLAQFYEIIIKDNNLATVDKIDYDTYKNLEQHFEYCYHTEKGETFPLDKDMELCRDILIVDDDNLYKLLDDLEDQGFCDNVEFRWIDGYGFDPCLAF